VPIEAYAEERIAKGDIPTMEEQLKIMPLLMGQAAGAVTSILPARAIVESMVAEAAAILTDNAALVRPAAKL
jgi:hypothetical protein